MKLAKGFFFVAAIACIPAGWLSYSIDKQQSLAFYLLGGLIGTIALLLPNDPAQSKKQ